jgi:hypothetical protein
MHIYESIFIILPFSTNLSSKYTILTGISGVVNRTTMGKKSKKKGSKTKLTASPALEKEILTVPVLPEIPVISTQPTVETKPVVKREAYDMTSLPAPLRHAFPYLTPKQQVLAKLLCSPLLGQAHLFENWPLDSDLEAKVDFVKQLEVLNEACPCGLAGFIGNARGKKISAEVETMELDMKELSGVGFVLVDDDDSNKEVSYLCMCWSGTASH